MAVDIIDKDKITLTKTEKELYNSWTGEYKEVMGMLGNIINENLSFRLIELAREKGINLEEGEWTFDYATAEFHKKPKKQEPKLEIPSEKK